MRGKIKAPAEEEFTFQRKLEWLLKEPLGKVGV